MSEVVIARRNGVLTGPEGERIAIRAGRTLADADHPVVALYPKVWIPVNVALRTNRADDGTESPITQLPAPQNAEGEPSEEGELAAQFRRLAAALRDLDALTDGPLTAAEVVEHTVAIVDEWKQRPGGATEQADERPPREVVREWAKSQGLRVGDKGRLADSVYAAYDEAHPAD